MPTLAFAPRRIRAQMADDGFLYLGGAESVLGISDAFATLPGHRGVYVCADRAGATDGVTLAKAG